MVYVQNHLGQPLMPTQDHRKVRLLLKAGAAVALEYGGCHLRSG